MTHSPNRLLSTIFGVVLLVVGILGFLLSTPYPFATAQGGVLIGLFSANGFLSLIHVLLGAILLLAGLGGVRPAKVFNILFGLGLVAFALVGFGIAHTGANIFALNVPTILLHLVAGLALAAAGLGADKVILHAPSTVVAKA